MEIARGMLIQWNQENSEWIQENDNEDNGITTKSNNTNEKDCPIAKIVIQKHPYNVSGPRPKAGTLGGAMSTKQYVAIS